MINSIFSIISFFIIYSTILSLGLAPINKFNPGAISIVSIVLALATQWKLKFTWNIPIKWLFGILLLYIASHLPQVQHATGGQDQGLYYSSASAFIKNHSLYIKDEFRSKLPHDLVSTYDAYVAPSITLIDKTNSIYTSDFYPAFPLLLGVGGFLFGKYNIGIVPLIVGFLLILYLIKILTLLSNSPRPVLIFGILALTINPALTFFSKGTYTEILGLFCSVQILTHLLQIKTSTRTSELVVHSLLTILGVTIYCLNRMAFPFLLPVLALMIFWGLFQERKQVRGAYLVVSTATIFLFWLTMVYYQLTLDVLYSASFFAPKMNLLRLGSICASSLLLIWMSLDLSSFNPIATFRDKAISAYQKIREKFQNLNPITYYLFIFLMIGLFFSVYFDKVFDPFSFQYNNKDFGAFRYSLPYKLFLFCGPLFFLAFINWNKKCLIPILVSIALSYTLLLTSIWTRKIPYLYYYGRYLFTDTFVFLVLLVGYNFANTFKKNWLENTKLVRNLVIAQVLYNAIFLIPQIGTFEGDGNTFFKEIEEKLNGNSILIVESKEFDRKMIDGIRYFLNKNVFVLHGKSGEEISSITANLKSSFPGYRIFITKDIKSEGGDSYEWNYKFLSNGEHLRIDSGVQLQKPNKLSIFFLPTKWRESSVSFKISEI